MKDLRYLTDSYGEKIARIKAIGAPLNFLFITDQHNRLNALTAEPEGRPFELAADAINAGIFNDLGSGGCPNVRIIRKNGTTDFLEDYRKQNKVEEFRRQYSHPATLDLPRGTVGRCEGET